MAGSPAPRRRQRSPEETRVALLAAGLDILAADPAEHAFGHLKAGRVAAAAGRTQGAFFHHWPSQDDYVFDLIEYAFAPERSTTLPVVERSLVDALASGQGLAGAVITAAGDAVRALPSDPQTAIEYLIWKRAVTDRAFGRWLLERYRRLDEANVGLFARLLELIHRRPRPPYTAETLVWALPALVQSVSMRALVDPDGQAGELTAAVVLSVLPLLTAADGDDRDVPAYLAWLGEQTGLGSEG